MPAADMVYMRVRLNSGHWAQKFGRWDQLLQRLRFCALIPLDYRHTDFQVEVRKVCKTGKNFGGKA